MIERLYKILWSHIGGRPWTYIMRDFAYQNPLLMIILGVNIGIYLQPWFELVHLAFFSTGLLVGHLFWGTKWRLGEKGK